MIDDPELLRRYVETRSEGAFAELVRRHVNLVHSVALRQLNGDAHLAADVTQAVFTDFARKAATLTGHRVLAGWFFTSTRFAAAKAVRSEQRRHAREQEAHTMHELTRDPAASLDWSQIRPVLDEAIAELPHGDREAVLLRYFEARDYATIGARLHLAENTARMRVERALERLRNVLERRGLTSTSSALDAALADQAVSAAPAGLAVAITGAALAGSAGGSATAAAGVIFMGMTKLQIGLAGALAVGSASGLMVQRDQNAALRAELAQLQAETQQAVGLRSEIQQLTALATEIEELRKDGAELARVRVEAASLKAKLAARNTRIVVSNVPSALPSGVYDLAQVDRKPQPRFQARPIYPQQLRNSGIGGEVTVDFMVDPQGNVQNARAVRSSRAEFEPAAVDAIARWRFTAAEKGGIPVTTRMQVPVVFTVEGAPARGGNESKPEPPPGY